MIFNRSRRIRWTFVILAVGVVGTFSAKSLILSDQNLKHAMTCPSMQECVAQAHRYCRGPYKLTKVATNVERLPATESQEFNILISCTQ